MSYEKGNRVVVCKECETNYTPSSRPYTCPNCSNTGFWLSPHEFEIQKLIAKSRAGCKKSYEKLGEEVLLMTKKLIWPNVWHPMESYIDEICSDVLFYFFRLYEKTTTEGGEIRCVYSYLSFITNCVSTTWSKKVVDHMRRKEDLSLVGGDCGSEYRSK